MTSSPSSALVAPGPSAGTVAVGTGNFPAYYQDQNNLRLKPCVDAAVPAYCGGTTSAEITAPDGEFFYNLVMAESADDKFLVEFALEGAFVGDGAGQEQVFNRFRFKAAAGSLAANTDYVVVHPYGKTPVHTNEFGQVTSKLGTVDDGCEVLPCNFGLAMPGDGENRYIQFLEGTTAKPAGFLGDGTTPQRITGSPTAHNSVEVYKGTAASGTPVWETSLFTVQGMVLAPGTPTPTPNPDPVVAPATVAQPVATSGDVGGAVTVLVDWAAPASDGGRRISSYEVVPYQVVSGQLRERPARTVATATGPVPTELNLTDLAAGRYRFRVRAINEAGKIGDLSAASNRALAR